MRGKLDGRRVAVLNWRDLDHSLAGGSERYAWEAARGLHAAGAKVDFLTARESRQSRREVRDGIVIKRRGGRFTFYPYTALALLLRRVLPWRRYDAVLDAENGIPQFAPLWVPSRTAVVLLVHHVHLTQFRTYFPWPLAAVGRFLEGRLMPKVYRSVRTIAVSESTRHEMVRQLGWIRKVTVVPNGSVQPRDLRGDGASSVDRLVVLGRLATHKRVDVVLEAVAALREQRPGLRVDVVGAGPEESRLHQLVTDLGLDEVATVHGFASEEEKRRLLLGARLHVSASDVEGWGQVVIEAAAHGVPTLARNVPGLRDSIRPGETGWLLDEPTGDLASVGARLVAGIESALRHLDDEEDRATMAKHCREWASGFTWERMHRDIVGIVGTEIERRAAKGAS